MPLRMSKKEYFEYYKKVLPMSDEDFKSFVGTIEKQIPGTFRIPESYLSDTVRKALGKYKQITKLGVLKDVYSFQYPPQKEVMDMVKTLSVAGIIQRQELSDMLPVELLNLEGNFKVLDICSAPGRKTEQIVEVINEKGFVVANDIKNKKINEISGKSSTSPDIDSVHAERSDGPNGLQIKKKQSSSILVTRNNARMFPKMYIKGKDLHFDRVLCAVPSSKDGMVRERLDILENWKIPDKTKRRDLFDLQCSIFRESCGFVKSGGSVIYTVPSMDPAECELVVREILRTQGNMEVVDFTGDKRFVMFPQKNKEKFTIRKGLKTWPTEAETIKELGISYGKNEKYDSEIEKCIRIYPQDQDTAATFIAVLRRKEHQQDRQCDEYDHVCDRCRVLNDEESDHGLMRKHGRTEKEKGIIILDGDQEEKLFRKYQITTSGRLIRRTFGGRSLADINLASDIAVKVISSTSDINIIDVGFMILRPSSLKDTPYTVKSVFQNPDLFKPSLEISSKEFGVLLEKESVLNKNIDPSFKSVGMSIVKVKDEGHFFCGFGIGEYYSLFINRFLRAALRLLRENN